MWSYEKKLQYPINIKTTNAQIAGVIMSQYGGPDGEISASMRYLSQRYAMPYRDVSGVLTDIGTEELAHLEMVATIVHQLTEGLTADEIKDIPYANYYIDHTTGIWPMAAGGIPFNSCEFQSSGDPITDLVEDLAAEQKARKTYDNILRIVKDPEVCDPIRFLRAREIVHFQRFGEALRRVQEHLDSKNFYAFNPAFEDASCQKPPSCTPGQTCQVPDCSTKPAVPEKNSCSMRPSCQRNDSCSMRPSCQRDDSCSMETRCRRKAQ